MRRPGVAADRPHRRRSARRRPAPQGGQQLRRRLQQHRRPRRHARGIAVGNTPGVLTDATADMAFCLLIAAGPPPGRWPPLCPVGAMEDVGAAGPPRSGPGRPDPGRGRHGPDRLRAGGAAGCGWDMKVLYHDMRRSEPAEKDLQARRVDLDTLLRESDFVSVHTDLNDIHSRPVQLAAIPQDEAYAPSSSTPPAARLSTSPT